MIDPRKPHIHAEAIKAWADGAEIEFRYVSTVTWAPCPHPNWDTRVHFRVKPQPHKWQAVMDAHNAGKLVQYRKARTSCTGSERPDTAPGFTWQPPLKKGSSTSYWDAWWLDWCIKPEPVVLYGRVILEDVGEGQGVDVHSSFPYGKCRTRGGQDNLKLTFEEGKLIAAEVLR